MTNYSLYRTIFIAAVLMASPCVTNTAPAGIFSRASHFPPTREQLRVFLGRLNITPEAICVAGLSTEHIAVLVQSGADTLISVQFSLENADAAALSARSQLATARLLGANTLDAAAQQAIHQAEAVLAARNAEQTAQWQAAFTTAVSPLPPDCREMLLLLRANAAYRLPLEYKTVARTPEEWASLEKAAQHVLARRACGLPANPVQANLFTRTESATPTVEARSRLATTLVTARTAWQTQLQNEP